MGYPSDEKTAEALPLYATPTLEAEIEPITLDNARAKRRQRRRVLLRHAVLSLIAFVYFFSLLKKRFQAIVSFGFSLWTSPRHKTDMFN